jgi:hypothetical protein
MFLTNVMQENETYFHSLCFLLLSLMVLDMTEQIRHCVYIFKFPYSATPWSHYHIQNLDYPCFPIIYSLFVFSPPLVQTIKSVTYKEYIFTSFRQNGSVKHFGCSGLFISTFLEDGGQWTCHINLYKCL